jgi:hypothetical protein
VTRSSSRARKKPSSSPPTLSDSQWYPSQVVPTNTSGPGSQVSSRVTTTGRYGASSTASAV